MGEKQWERWEEWRYSDHSSTNRDVNINNAERTIILVIIITIIINNDSRSQVSEMY